MRLDAIISLIKYKTLGDIGTDHAYLPIKAYERGTVCAAIATDINKGPLKVAAENIKKAGLEHRIDIRHGNGLETIKQKETDCIVIAGMGGMQIWDIIKKGLIIAKEAKQLLLSPQHNIETLRRNLHSEGFDITNEAIVQEGKFYTIIETKYTGILTKYTDKEYFLGKYKQGPVWQAFLQSEYTRIKKYIDKNKHDVIKLQWIKEEL